MLTVCGKTPEGRLAVGGVYGFYETYGLPLDLICEELWQRWMIPAWDDFYLAAAQSGVGHHKLMTKINEAAGYMQRLNRRTT